MQNRLYITAAFIILACSAVSASTTDIWMTASAEDFARGKLENVTILSTGQLAPGMGTARLEVEEISIWSAAIGPDGMSYIGTGNNGIVYRVSGNKVEKAFGTDEAVVTSLVWAGDTLFAATIPGGKIYSWKPGGECRLAADLDVDYIWDMIYYTGLRTIIIGTGPQGKIISMATDGKADVFFDSNESHVLSLAQGKDMALFAGTSMRGVLFEFRKNGSVSSTWDLDDNEVRALSFHNGSLYVASNKIKSYERELYFMGEGDMYQDRSQFAHLLAARISQLGAGQEAVEKSFQELFDVNIYRLTPEKDMHRILGIPSRYACDIGVDRDSVIYIATGDEGELWAATEPNLGWVMMDLKEAQILSIGIHGNALAHVATANAAAVYRTQAKAAESAQFTSEIKDTGFRSKWGQIEWKSTGPIEIVTRTGNHSIPDSTWSAWSDPLSESGSGINSPNARFIQFRVRWKKDREAKVDWIRLAYINENQRPHIEQLMTAQLRDGMPSTKGLPQIKEEYYARRLKEVQGKVRIQWKATDPDGDTLIYWLYYRREGDREWVIINPKEPVRKGLDYYDLSSIIQMKRSKSKPQLADVSHDWSINNLADGWYMIKVVASDELDNAVNRKKVWKETGPILIDNRKPEIAELIPSGKLKWTGRAKDGTSHIARIEYNLDGEKWEILRAKDGIYDNNEEEFRIELKNVIPGEHVLTVRALDEGGNIGMRQVGFTQK